MLFYYQMESEPPARTRTPDGRFRETSKIIGWLYLSDATCLIRPHLLYALFIVLRIIMIWVCYILRHF